MAIEFLPFVLPSSLHGLSNGELPNDVMEVVELDGVGDMQLHPVAARCFRALRGKIRQLTGAVLTATGMYRPRKRSIDAFYERMVPTFDPEICAVDRHGIPYGSRYGPDGELWFLRKGKIPVAGIGRKGEIGIFVSTIHGWGCAFDGGWFTGVERPGLGDVADIDGDAHLAGWASLVEWAVPMGWSWEGARPGRPGWEAHHLRLICGDEIPLAVLEFEEGDMQTAIAAIYRPGDNVTVDNPKTFVLLPDGRVRHASGPDVKYAVHARVFDTEIEGDEHYGQLDKLAARFTP